MKGWSWPAALRRLAAAALLAVAAALPCHAQARSPAAVDMQVTDGETGGPLAGATVRVDGVARAVSDSLGRVILSGLEPGRHVLEIALMGHRRISPEVEVFAGEMLSLEVVLDPERVVLPPVVVGPPPGWDGAGAAGRPGYRGMGRYFAREEIQRSRARRLTELLVMVGVLQPNGRMRAARCDPRVVADGLVISGSSIDVFPLQDLEAVQVFTDSDVPAEFGGSSAGSCGVVVVWTRHK